LSFRAGLGLGLLAAMLAALPATVRLALQGESFGQGWLLLAGGGALVMGPAVALARAARPLPLTVLAVLAGTAAASVPLAVFARLLHQNTHHRPLGAATFAVFALIVVALASFATWRALVWVERARPRLPQVAGLGLPAAAAVLLLALAAGASSSRGSIADAVVVLALIVMGVAVRLNAAWSDRLSRLAPPMWALLVIVATWLSTGAVGPVVGQAAPVLSPLNGW